MKNNSEKIEGKLVETIKIDGLADLTKDFTELGIDLVLKDGILKDIPIAGTIVNISKTIGSIRDLLYLKKLLSFLHIVGKTTQQQRENFIQENCQNTRQFEEGVLLILEQVDNMNKSALIGKIFKACILGKITYEDAIRLSEMINRASWQDLNCLISNNLSPLQQRKLCLVGIYDYDGNTTYAETNKGDMKTKPNYYTSAIVFIGNEQYEKLQSNPL